MTSTSGRRRTDTLFASVQELGGAAEQTDHVRAGAVRTAGGEQVLLAVVADGDRGSEAGQAAARVVAQVFQAVEQSRTGDLGQVLRRGLELAHQSLLTQMQSGAGESRVAATAIAISRNRAYTAHSGSGVAIRVSRGRASRLTQRTEGRLGAADGPGILTGPAQGFSLERGDRVVLTSDGLSRLNPASGQPFVLPGEIAQHATDLAPSHAARHLISLALGRDVDDNVSVAVLALPGAVRPGRRSPLRGLLVAGTVVGVIVVAALVATARSRPEVTNDYGFAVLVAGGVRADLGDGVVESVGNLGTIPVSSIVSALTEARLSLQSTFEAGSDLGEGTLYLGPDSQLELVALDPRVATSGSDSVSQSGPTQLRLDRGTLLVLRANGTREYQVNGPEVTASLSGAGRGAMGVEADGGDLFVACLIGACRVNSSSGQDQLLQAGESITAVRGAPGLITSIPTEALANWVELCAGCLPGG